ncbi:MAG: glycoside hydrolase 5 family protein [Planctomycetota bacterium]|jgi:endo-1,4-beta-mannosidase
MLRYPVVLVLMASAANAAAATELAVENTRFTLDGEPTFLLGASYYGALGASEKTIRRDLDDLARLGVNWIRVWATWAAFDHDVSAVDDQGNAREPYMARLEWLVGECDRRAVVVDATLTRGGRIVGTHVESLPVHRKAVETLVRRLASHRNWYLDLGNERNIRDERFVGFDDLEELLKTVKRFDPKRLVTASHAGDIPEEDLRKYVIDVGVDFISPHRPRNARSPGQTRSKSQEYLAGMKRLGRVVPVHYQEPFRRSFSRGWEPTVDDFVADLKGAIAGGAAGWCFHNGDARRAPEQKPRRSFDMRDKRLFEQLDEVELEALEGFRKAPSGERR